MATMTQPIPTQKTSLSFEEESPGSLLDLRHRITVQEFHRIVEAGVFGPEPRVELLEGIIVEKMSKNPPHILATDLIQHLMNRLLPPGLFVSMGNPVTIEERDSEPEPDASVLRGQIRDYTGRTRTPSDAALVIEVADTSYAYDRHQKSITYAASGVPVYWILDLNRRRLEVHTVPVGQKAESPAYYSQSRIYGQDEEVPIVLDGREIARFAVREILP
jgi:Uma2 family endonuclease